MTIAEVGHKKGTRSVIITLPFTQHATRPFHWWSSLSQRES